MNTASVARSPRTGAGALVLFLLGALAVCSVVPAAAVSAPAPSGRISRAFQYRDGSIWVAGNAYDRSSPGRSIRVCVAVGGRCVRDAVADQSSPAYDRAHHITGAHRFTVRIPRQRAGVRLALMSGRSTLAAVTADSPGARAARIARHYVGARYTEGGSSPRSGFDCSGFTRYVYGQADVASLPHNAEAQRHVRYMRHISRAAARPGDLIFYFSGGAAYHVAVYAGHGYQYAAATPGQGVRYQRIWSNDIEFRTDWH
jgi:hypothetical protein